MCSREASEFAFHIPVPQTLAFVVDFFILEANIANHMLSLLGPLVLSSLNKIPEATRDRPDGLQGPHQEWRTRAELRPCSWDYPKLKIQAVKDGSSIFGRIRLCSCFKLMCRFDRQKGSELGAGLLGVCLRSADVGLAVRDSGFQLLTRDFGCDFSMSPSQ